MAQVIKLHRTTTAGRVPTALNEGELAANIADEPIRMWIGTSSGVKELFAGAAVEDAEDDAVYGRCNGDWVEVPIVTDALPQDPSPNSLWFNAADGVLYLWYGEQWIGVTGGPQRPMFVLNTMPPADPIPNLLWCDSRDMRLYVYTDQWVEVGR